jgi:hypothetical protein
MGHWGAGPRLQRRERGWTQAVPVAHDRVRGSPPCASPGTRSTSHKLGGYPPRPPETTRAASRTSARGTRAQYREYARMTLAEGSPRRCDLPHSWGVPARTGLDTGSVPRLPTRLPAFCLACTRIHPHAGCFVPHAAPVGGPVMLPQQVPAEGVCRRASLGGSAGCPRARHLRVGRTAGAPPLVPKTHHRWCQAPSVVLR